MSGAPPAADRLRARIAGHEARVGVIGLGYVGLPLALAFHERGFSVAGFDLDPEKIAALERGTSYIRHLSAARVRAASASETFVATTDFSRLGEADAILICVPTPLGAHREPDMSYVEATARQIATTLRPGQLVVLESTTYPGTTDELVLPILEATGLRCGTDFFLAYSPEREDPGNHRYSTTSIPKVVGGVDETSREVADALYREVVVETVPVSSTRVAEAAKLTENVFRAVNIALVNELKLVYERMGIDIWEVLDAADTKPFGYMRFNPGPGWGGHCIPLDPFYLAWKARAHGKSTRFIELAGEINTAMPEHVVQRVVEALNARGRAARGSRILILGLAYKANVDDDRESPSYHLMDLLAGHGAAMAYHDPYVPVIRPSREHGHWAGTESVPWTRESIGGFDAVVIATAHDAIDYAQLAEWSACIVDTRNAMAGVPGTDGRVWKA